MSENPFIINPIGIIRSTLKDRSQAPRQGSEGAPDAWLEILPDVALGLSGIAVGDDLIILTWLHQSQRSILQVHPRGESQNPLTGVFATRSPDRPNPIGLHRVTVLEIAQHRLRVGPIEVIDGTPVIDIKPALTSTADF